VERGVPTCPRHGPRWKLVRNASAADVLIVRDDRVLLSRRAIEPFLGRWELPGGMQDLGEHPADTARREVREELGLDVALTGLLGFYLDPFEDGFCQTTVFLGRVDGDPSGGDAESLGWSWFAAGDLPPAAEMAWTHRQRLDDWRALGERPHPPALGLS
jgi:ADP-ribose pyrophosphatase YjhB (NUDIX family)